MFEFAISQHRKRPPSRKLVASWVFSVIAHTAALGILIEFPELLRGGSHMWLRFPTLTVSPSTEPTWRTVAVIASTRSMDMPSAETLRRAMYHWSESAAPRSAPPVRVSWGDDRPVSSGDTTQPAPPVRPSLGTEEPKPVPEIASASPAGVNTAQQERPGSEDPSSREFPVSVAGTGGADQKKTAVFLPAPTNAAPRQIPPQIVRSDRAEATGTMIEPNTSTLAESKLPDAGSAQSRTQPRLFVDEQSAIRSEGSGLFDTKGFPLGEYAQVIIDRIKGNWLIPSNLRNSQGRSTLIFFIEKDGSVLNLRVVTSSGSQSLDLAALSAVLASKPLPPLPGGFPGEHVGAKFVFSYNEPQ